MTKVAVVVWVVAELLRRVKVRLNVVGKTSHGGGRGNLWNKISSNEKVQVQLAVRSRARLDVLHPFGGIAWQSNGLFCVGEFTDK